MTYRYRLSFTDVDYARLMFSGDYYRWAERAFESWQIEMGLPWRRMISELHVGLPSIETRCHYLAPLSFEQEFDVSVAVRDLTGRGFVTDFEIVRAEDAVIAAHGYFVRRFIDMRSMRGTPDVPREVLDVFAAMQARSSIDSYDQRAGALRREREERRRADPATAG